MPASVEPGFQVGAICEIAPLRLPFGTTPDGDAVERVTLRNSAGIEVSIISYGAAIQELWAPDRDGRRANLVLGFADLDGYTSEPNYYFGAIVGRFANRIAMGRTLRDSEIIASMGSKGDPWDDASAESCMSTIKNELV